MHQDHVLNIIIRRGLIVSPHLTFLVSNSRSRPSSSTVYSFQHTLALEGQVAEQRHESSRYGGRPRDRHSSTTSARRDTWSYNACCAIEYHVSLCIHLARCTITDCFLSLYGLCLHQTYRYARTPSADTKLIRCLVSIQVPLDRLFT